MHHVPGFMVLPLFSHLPPQARDAEGAWNHLKWKTMTIASEETLLPRQNGRNGAGKREGDQILRD